MTLIHKSLGKGVLPHFFICFFLKNAFLLLEKALVSKVRNAVSGKEETGIYKGFKYEETGDRKSTRLNSSHRT